MQDREFTQICKEILALSEKIKELNLSRLETISVEIKLAKNSFDDKSGEMDAKIAEFNAVAQRLEPLKQSLAKAEEILAKIKENGGAGVSEEKAKQLINEAVDGLRSAVEELKQKTPIDDETAAENKTFSSKKIEQTFAKKSEAADVSTLATKEELNTKLDAETYNSQKANYALKSQLSSYARKSELSMYTVAQNLSGNMIDFTQGVNFVGQNISGQLTATNITAEQNRGKSGLIYIHGNGVTSLSSDFQIINPDDATYGKGYVFLSYFINPFDNKVIVQFIKKAA